MNFIDPSKNQFLYDDEVDAYLSSIPVHKDDLAAWLCINKEEVQELLAQMVSEGTADLLSDDFVRFNIRNFTKNNK